MYLSETIKIPEIPGKITRRKMGNNVYVLLETGRVYDPKRQFNIPHRVTIGKLVAGTDETLMQPNEKFLERVPEIFRWAASGSHRSRQPICQW